eukprot:TRINITY_DN36721_c0_g1_i1.p1 TRINITY_DN36721_c0_g1~~TRINITY_DN36721_c0_g1_i1.p1  ORF type:complete len:348 (+),score=69.50 TRINITY_DN36721_c0_g1_i1:350-1393(+)
MEWGALLRQAGILALFEKKGAGITTSNIAESTSPSTTIADTIFSGLSTVTGLHPGTEYRVELRQQFRLGSWGAWAPIIRRVSTLGAHHITLLHAGESFLHVVSSRQGSGYLKEEGSGDQGGKRVNEQRYLFAVKVVGRKTTSRGGSVRVAAPAILIPKSNTHNTGTTIVPGLRVTDASLLPTMSVGNYDEGGGGGGDDGCFTVVSPPPMEGASVSTQPGNTTTTNPNTNDNRHIVEAFGDEPIVTVSSLEVDPDSLSGTANNVPLQLGGGTFAKTISEMNLKQTGGGGGRYKHDDVDDDLYLFETTSPEAAVSYTHLRAHETPEHLVCRLLLEKKKIKKKTNNSKNI